MNLPRSTRYKRLRGCPTRGSKAVSQQYLTSHEETVLWDFLVAKENEMGGKRVRNEEIRLIAQHIRCQRHSDETLRRLPEDSNCNDMDRPGKNWVGGFVDRQVARGVDSRGDKSAVNNRQKIDPWLADISERLRPTKVLDKNIFHLVAVGGAMPGRADPQKLVNINDLEEFTRRRRAAAVVTIVECVSQADELLSPLIIWPKATSNDSLDHATSLRFANLVSEGRLEEAGFFYWLQHVFEPQTHTRADKRRRFVLLAQKETFWSERIQKFCREQDIVLCDAHGAPWKTVLPDVSLYAAWMPSIVETLQQLYTRNAVSGIGFLEGYCGARVQAFKAQDKMIAPAPVQTFADNGTDDDEAGSTSEFKMPTAAAFEQMAFEVQHDLACLDIDREERELIDHFISTAKVFAAFYFNRLAEGL